MIFALSFFARRVNNHLCTLDLTWPYSLLISFIFRWVCNDQRLIQISGNNRDFLVVNGVKNFIIGFVQSSDIYKICRTSFSELCWIQGNITVSLLHLFKGMRDDISPIPDAVKRPVICTSKTGIWTENKFTTVKIFYDFHLQWLKRCLLVLITWKNIKCKRNAISIHKQPHTNNRIWTVLFAFPIVLQAAFFLDLKVIIRTVIVKYLLISWMDEVWIFV